MSFLPFIHYALLKACLLTGKAMLTQMKNPAF